jgi:hypothetical protein
MPVKYSPEHLDEIFNGVNSRLAALEGARDARTFTAPTLAPASAPDAKAEEIAALEKRLAELKAP